MAKQALSAELNEVKDTLEGGMKRALDLLYAAQAELSSVSDQKAALDRETKTAHEDLDALKQEYRALKETTQEASVAAAKAKQDRAAQESAAKAELDNIDGRIAEAQRKEQAALQKLRQDREATMDDLDKRLAAKQKLYDDFINSKLTK